ncbi:uncharacterized protein [Nicotiana tomentosiformis]|uniref:uncharacterized protein n=1 Tax=Nicotiana tomentosiformis TaxID=4098 RepID=UPI00388C54CA
MASAIGTPIYADECTAKKIRKCLVVGHMYGIEKRPNNQQVKQFVRRREPKKDRLRVVDCEITTIYGYNTLEQRKQLWKTVKELSVRITKPWLLCGDFNDVLYPNDRLLGNPISYIEIQEFADCVTLLSLSELPWTEEYYTWSNKQHGADRVCSRLDKAFAPKHGKVPFRFFNVWVEHDSFIYIMKRIWRQSYATCQMKNIWMMLKAQRPHFRTLNSEQFRTISLKIEQARVELENIQEKINITYNDTLLEEERSILQNLEK